MRADILADLPRVRAAPLGWGFPLAFVVHAAAPGGVLFGLSLGGVIPTPWSYFGIVVGALLAVAGGGGLLAYALKVRNRIEAMREASHGIAARATIVSAEVGMGSFRSRRGGRSFRATKMILTLDVWMPSGQRYRAVQEGYFGTQEVGALQQGAPLTVYVHPRDPQIVFVPFCRPPQQQATQPRGRALGTWG